MRIFSTFLFICFQKLLRISCLLFFNCSKYYFSFGTVLFKVGKFQQNQRFCIENLKKERKRLLVTMDELWNHRIKFTDVLKRN